MTFYIAVHLKINYSVTYRAAHSFKLFFYELLQTNGIKWHLACSAQNTSRSLKAVKSFKINFCWKFRVLRVSAKLFLPLVFEVNGPTMQHNLSDGALVLLCSIIASFYCLLCASVCKKTQNKNVCAFVSGAEWPSIYLSRRCSDRLFRLFRLSHSVGSGLLLTIHAAQRCDESKISESTVGNFLQMEIVCPFLFRFPPRFQQFTGTECLLQCQSLLWSQFFPLIHAVLSSVRNICLILL